MLPRRTDASCGHPIFPDLASSVIQQELSMRNLLLSTAAVLMAGAASAALAHDLEVLLGGPTHPVHDPKGGEPIPGQL